MPNPRMADARKTSLQQTPCGIIRVTALCELCRYRHKSHWSGAEHRLARKFGKRFGDDVYSMEELVAELGSAFLCGDLGLSSKPRPDHARYLASWLKVLKADNRAIFTAASAAAKAADWLSNAPHKLEC